MLDSPQLPVVSPLLCVRSVSNISSFYKLSYDGIGAVAVVALVMSIASSIFGIFGGLFVSSVSEDRAGMEGGAHRERKGSEGWREGDARSWAS